MHQQVDRFDYREEDFLPDRRPPGISGFMRTRNGAEFIALTISSHMDCLDELVVVYNQCDDGTPEILEELRGVHGPKLRVYHYTPRVFPLNSDAHKRTPGDSPNSFVAMSNLALSLTRFQTMVKVDDDHLALKGRLSRITDEIRLHGLSEDTMIAFSGINLMRDPVRGIGYDASFPYSGKGDIGFYNISPERLFFHDRRFERFSRKGLSVRFGDIVYWHTKLLKREKGLANYELAENPESRGARKARRFARARFAPLSELTKLPPPPLWRRLLAKLDGKSRIISQRRLAALTITPEECDTAVAALGDVGAEP